MKSFSIVGRRYSANSSHRFSPFFSDRFERRGLVYVGANINNAAHVPSSNALSPAASWLDESQTFNGTSDKVVIGNPSKLNFTGEITLTATVKIDSFNGLQDIFAHGYKFNPNAEVFLRLNGNKIQVGSYNGQTYYAESTLSESDLGQWITFTGTYDGENWNLYKDGVLIASSASSVGAVTVNANWVIGASAQNNRYFKGEIKDVAIWNEALSSQDVQTLSQGGLSQYTVVNESTYNVLGWLTSSTDAEGNATSYTYDSMGRVLTVTDALNQTTSYSYDLLGRVYEQTTDQGAVTRFTYDAVGNVITTQQYDSTQTALPVASWLDEPQTFNGTSDKVVIGNQSKLNFTGEITLTATVKIDSFNGLQDIFAHGYKFNPNAEVFLRLNSNKIQVGSYNGQTYYAESTLSESDLGQWITFTGTYDGENWNLYKDGVLIASSASSVGAVTVNANWVIGASAQNNRYFKGEIKDVAIWNEALSSQDVQTLSQGGLSQYTVVNQSAYNALGWLTSSTDAEGNTTSYTYDSMGRVLTVTDALGNTTSYVYDLLGRVYEQTTDQGAVTRFTYDAVGNVITTQQYDSTQTALPAASRLDEAQTFNGISDKVVIGNQSELNFTGEITLTATVKIDSFNGLQDILAHGYTFRPNAEVFLRLSGNKIQAGSYNGQTYYAESTLSESDLGQWITITGTYDGENWNLYKDGVLIASSASSVGAVTVNADWVIGASAQNNRYFKGEIKDVAIYRGALTATQVAALYNGTLENNIVTTSYAYTPTGAVASITDPEGNTTSYSYDYRGLAVSETNAKGYTRYFEYDAAGRLTEKTDRNGRVTTYTYDAAGRLTAENWLDSSNNAVQSFTYTYDLSGNLLTVSDGVSSYAYTYDTMNRIDSMTIMFDAQMAVFSYTYDTLGRQTESSLRLNGVQDRTINIEYDYLGRAISAELTGNALNDILVELDHDNNGLISNINRYEWDDNDDLYELIAKSNIQRNANNQITNITHTDAADAVIASHSYLFSPDGNIIQYTNSIDGTVTYTNDFLGQLIGADYSNLDITDESYQYDLNGNRELVTNANGDLVVYSTGTNNELTSDGAYTYAYDAEGNRISKTNAAGTERELYEWDYRNRLESVTKQEYNATTQEWETVQIVEYAYDYNNVLIRKVLDVNGDGVSDSKTIFLPENYQTAVQLDDADLSDLTDATVSHRYLWTPQNQDKLLADIQVSPTGSETLWSLTDHLGTIRDVVKNTPSGLLVPAHVIYDAYGNVLSCKDAYGTDVSNPVIFGFTGKYFDADTQLQNNVNRWYDSAIGRWLSTDPIGFNGNDTNLYMYVGNMSILLVDVRGYEKKYLDEIDAPIGSFQIYLKKVRVTDEEQQKYLGSITDGFKIKYNLPPNIEKRSGHMIKLVQAIYFEGAFVGTYPEFDYEKDRFEKPFKGRYPAYGGRGDSTSFEDAPCNTRSNKSKSHSTVVAVLYYKDESGNLVEKVLGSISFVWDRTNNEITLNGEKYNKDKDIPETKAELPSSYEWKKAILDREKFMKKIKIIY